MKDAVNPCPHCRSLKVYRSHRRSAIDRVLYALGAEIRRCSECRFRHAWFTSFSIPLPAGKPASKAVAASH